MKNKLLKLPDEKLFEIGNRWDGIIGTREYVATELTKQFKYYRLNWAEVKSCFNIIED